MDPLISESEINLPDVLAELDLAFDQYEAALVQNNVSVLDKFFWDNPKTVRYGVAENLYGGEEIRAYRMTCNPVPPGRRITQKKITSFGRNFAVVSAEFISPDSEQTGRQMQTWVCFSEGWRIVAAHVSLKSDT
ncbi:MAG: oxalurate catabolism protein HpxZ [Nitrosomonadaceae bacterium]|jgi:hypothetical protein